MDSKTYICAQTKVTPYVNLNVNEGLFEIRGRSITLNTPVFYDPIIDWMNEHLKGEQIEMKLGLEYFNTASHIYIMSVINTVHDLNPENIVVWEYESGDEEMKELGKNMEGLSHANFRFEAVSHN